MLKKHTFTERCSEKYGKLSCLSVGGYRSKGENTFEDYTEEVVIPQWGRALKGKEETLDHRENYRVISKLISALQRKNGLKRCPDKGLEAMRLWVAGGVFSRNLVTYGRFLMKKRLKAVLFLLPLNHKKSDFSTGLWENCVKNSWI